MKKRMILAAALFTVTLALPTFSTANSVQSNIILTENEMETELTFIEITKEEVPEVISEGLAKEYADFSIDNYYLGSDGTYKIIVSDDDSKWALFFDQMGKIYEKEEVKSDIAE